MAKKKFFNDLGDFNFPREAAPCDPALPRRRWDEALPLGNGLLGVLVWQDGDTLTLSLDRADLWDERRPGMERDKRFHWRELCRMARSGAADEMREVFQKHADEPYPTKLPGGRLTVPWPGKSGRFELDEAAAHAVISDGVRRLEVWVSAADREAIYVCFEGFDAAEWQIAAAAFENHAGEDEFRQIDLLGYPPAEHFEDGAIRGVTVANHDGSFSHGLGFGIRMTGDHSGVLAATVTSGDNRDTVRKSVANSIRLMLDEEIGTARRRHREWWNRFWSNSRVRLGDAELNAYYRRARYFFGSLAREWSPPMALQGVWTADEMALPPWRGDYHNNLNVQFCYVAYLAANDLAGGRQLLEFLFALLPEHRRWAREFYGVRHPDGAVVPGAMTMAGNVVPGSANYTYHPDNGLWIGHLFYRHWRYTLDEQFLRDRAYPYCRSLAEAVLELLSRDDAGYWRFDWSVSPELGDDWPESYFTELTAYDNACLCACFANLAEMAGAVGDTVAVRRWRECLSHCRSPESMTAQYHYYLYDKTVLGIQPGTALPCSHRHFSHLMAFYPFDLPDYEHDEAWRELVENSFSQLDLLGTGQWVGFSFSQMAVMAARAGWPVKARRFLGDFIRGFTFVNGLHCNGDYRNFGFSAYKYRPFTLEGNFLAQEAIHELLLSESHGVLRFFPGAEVLGDAEFAGLRAPGALLVDGVLKAGRIVKIVLHAEKSRPCTFANPGQRRWQIAAGGEDRIADGAEITVTPSPGCPLTLTLAD